MADRVMVMYAGKPVETGDVDEIFFRSRMPYTLGLLGSLPRLDVANPAPLQPDSRRAAVADRPAARLPVRTPLPGGL